jgi:hypothetical protein
MPRKKPVQANLDQHQEDSIHYMVATSERTQNKIIRDCIDTCPEVVEIDKRLKAEPGFKKEFQRKVLVGREICSRNKRR